MNSFKGTSVTKRLVISGVLLALATGVSCRRAPAIPPAPAKGPSAYITQGITVWGENARSNGGRPGLDFAHIAYGTWDDRVVFAVWVDFDRTRSGDHFNETSEALEKKYAGELYDGDSKATFECKTANGAAGTLTVNARNFDLADGWLVLASPARGELKQLNPERIQAKTESLTMSPELFEKLKSDPEIQSFFDFAAKHNKQE